MHFTEHDGSRMTDDELHRKMQEEFALAYAADVAHFEEWNEHMLAGLHYHGLWRKREETVPKE